MTLAFLQPHPNFRHRIERIGAEHAPVLVVDDFLADTDALIDAAAASTYVDIGPVYPGVRAPAPEAYASALVALLSPLVEAAFGAPWAPELDLCAFSMVTTPPEALGLMQRLPHFDGVETERLAFLHYLCDPKHGGTSFYRQCRTGFESVDADRLDEYRAALHRDLEKGEPAAGYANGDTRMFERIASFDAVFNRILVYRGSNLHSGDIAPGGVLIEDARSGRLTVNGFGWLQGHGR